MFVGDVVSQVHPKRRPTVNAVAGIALVIETSGLSQRNAVEAKSFGKQRKARSEKLNA